MKPTHFARIWSSILSLLVILGQCMVIPKPTDVKATRIAMLSFAFARIRWSSCVNFVVITTEEQKKFKPRGVFTSASIKSLS
ncbi:uncharacterized protein PITG_22674 [Phytophthora infestans T30-4]|uniref:Secreted RxLR effector peptide protein n=1 Tax=Phytophthora infestans (strain T30-4) TaxID=403677 RepID=D0MUT6_PHYIT|nr:uncharacterized protein PITG_22674 [Phytophthora infestans T30-4]EEY60932.1 conserved hypothetical protein [Phytophthora infestans T30-4]|eukprot:XP_002907849.1 conserved hypothetical protein [Phytophthora infestans T30-4]